jgi:multiple sugar transport system ATP-binding protein
VINKGVLQQVGSPQELYRYPRNTFVAGFIGSPAMNLVEASLVSDNQGTAVLMGEHRLAIPDEVLTARSALRGYLGRKVAFGIRPEDMEDVELAFGVGAGGPNAAGAGSDAGSGATVQVTVAHHEDMGSELLLYFDVEAPPVFTEDIQGLAAEQGEDALRSLEEQARKQRANIVARVSARSDARSGQQAAVYLDMRNAHFFDLTSGEAIAGDTIAVGTPAPATGSTS